MSNLRQKIRPPALAKMWGVGVDKILGFIRRGELRAIDVSDNRGVGRPRYLIDLADIAAFEQSRAVVPPPPPVQRRRRRRDIILKDYFS